MRTMRSKVYPVALFLSLLALSYAVPAHAQMGPYIPIGGIPVGIPPTPAPPAPVAPPPPSMMPPAPPPPGNTFVETGGISEYGSTITGGTVLATSGTDFTGGPAMAMPVNPLFSPPYAPAITQTDEVLRSLYPSGSVRVAPAGRAYAGSVPPRGTTASPPVISPPGPGEPMPGARPDRAPGPSGVPPLGGEATGGPGAPPAGR